MRGCGHGEAFSGVAAGAGVGDTTENNEATRFSIFFS